MGARLKQPQEASVLLPPLDSARRAQVQPERGHWGLSPGPHIQGSHEVAYTESTLAGPVHIHTDLLAALRQETETLHGVPHTLDKSLQVVHNGTEDVGAGPVNAHSDLSLHTLWPITLHVQSCHHTHLRFITTQFQPINAHTWGPSLHTSGSKRGDIYPQKLELASSHQARFQSHPAHGTNCTVPSLHPAHCAQPTSTQGLSYFQVKCGRDSTLKDLLCD